MSAASAVGEAVLAAVVRVLADDPCTFKFAAGEQRLREINSRNSDRGSAGKFITVYPADDEQFRRLAAALDRATAGLPGPAVLSDRPYRPGSRVHYRYGAFAARAELGNDGEYRSVLRGPGGERVVDVRGASYRAPGWVRDPFAAASAVSGTSSASGARRRGGVLLAGRYAITSAVRHGTKGGVFLGREAASGTEVVVKQARAHIETDRAGTDARDALRHEAALLTRLAGRDLAPAAIELIEQDDSVFLVQERIAGQPLGSWVTARLRRDGTPDVDWTEAEPIARALLDLVSRVHAEGLVLRDLSPGNVMVRPDGTLRLVDLELAAEAGRPAGSAGTPGYRAPEQGPGRLTVVTDGTCLADPAADLYALGGLYFLLATGHDPVLPEDLPQARPVTERLTRWLTLAARTGTTARRLAPAILALRAEEAAERWSLAQVREALFDDSRQAPAAAGQQSDTSAAAAASARVEGLAEGAGPSTAVAATVASAAATGRPSAEGGRSASAATAPPSTAPQRRTSTAHLSHGVPAAARRLGGVGAPVASGADRCAADLDRVLHDGLRHLAGTATPGRRDRLWPVVPAGERTDPCNVQHGAAGVLAVLARAVLVDGLPSNVRAAARRTVQVAAEWVERRCAAEPVVLPGLHFGRSGAAWALLDAARALGDDGLAERAAATARRVPVEWPNPDVCHGAAGAGFTQLRFAADALDGDADAFLARAARCGHALLGAARREPYGLVWPVPTDFDSALAGITHLGFAHGVAGVGAFLLAAAEATGDRALLAGAAEAGRTLAATVRREAGAAWWPQSADDAQHVRLAHWCSGASGAGTFLLRLWQVTGDATAHELALAAGRAVLAGRWHSGVSACHGLAGNGEYLLDLAEATGSPEFCTGAEELAELIAARSALRNGLLVLPDETGTGCAAGYGTGTAGALAFLLRWRHGGPRIWVDPAPPAVRQLPSSASEVSPA
ncbi:protein kinase/lanthionine synthetase C family protein [Kitasatospora aureofaciens]|uniref:class III lanthionine synthetase LanKC N-terminal domain-containing protein n=1 Tax=Kitasatospora aureofaciens TaxID=1894 RepID=UPI001C4686AB|nr:lanthionine synthetase LanC family protein [Kitasatospora aureofaciens]MBV6696072.1 protein kinase/lanthionine synthetase C family protein [Kitasatospora aureofaciens]